MKLLALSIGSWLLGLSAILLTFYAWDGENLNATNVKGATLMSLTITALAERIVTTSPDVTVSTNLGPWVNRRGLFARESMADTFKSERIPSTFNWEFSPKGQHIELGIAEMNLFIMLSALGLSHAINGERLLPVGTLYDPFIERGLDALNYACYQDARFMLVATPSGVTLAPEGGAHQSIGTPLIGLAQDGLAAFEPAFVDELAVIMAWAFDYLQREGEAPRYAHEVFRLESLRGGHPSTADVTSLSGALMQTGVFKRPSDRTFIGLLLLARVRVGSAIAVAAAARSGVTIPHIHPCGAVRTEYTTNLSEYLRHFG